VTDEAHELDFMLLMAVTIQHETKNNGMNEFRKYKYL